jgi:hypothetical protein
MTYLARGFLILLVLWFIQACVTPVAETPRPRVTLSADFKPEQYKLLAVIVFDETRRFHYSGALREVEDEFMRAIIERGYKVAARSDVDKILQELKFQRSGLTEREVARIGKLLGVPAVILVSINRISAEPYQPMISQQGVQYYNVTASISARLISTEQGEVLWLSSYTGSSVSTSRDQDKEARALAPVARVVASGLPSASY